MTSSRIPIIVGLLVSVALIAWLFWPRSEAPSPVKVSQAPAPALPQAKKPEGPQHPLQSEADPALPALKESDGAIASALAPLFGGTALPKFLRPEELIRNIVATVDNLPREAVAARVSPVQPVGGMVATTGKGENVTIAPKNAERYSASIKALESVDPGKLAALYVRFYPLFQQAYVDLGYPGRNFNDRLIEVIDHLLAAPEPKEPLKLVQPKVLYEFADPRLEEASAGHKILLRIGNANAARVKTWLRALRGEILARTVRK